jgi:predicted phosphoadenosine phosphosulfate sulfurtransferase
MSKINLGIDVLEAARRRISVAFDDFEKICVSFSAGKDSTVMLHLIMEEAIKRKRRVGILFIDLEAQYKLTIDCAAACFELYRDHIDPMWVCLPIHLRNAVSVFAPFWKCWDKDCEKSWVRVPPEWAITDGNYFPFFHDGMEFEEFVPEFAKWYADGQSCAFFVGIRTDESYSRFLAIASGHKRTYKGLRYTTGVDDETQSFNFYPIYDWSVQDIWIYHARNKTLPYNGVYDRMHLAGMSPAQMRICQPYGDDQRKGLWLFHLIEPETWARVVARVNGANSGSLYAQEHGNINGYRKIAKPPHLTWKEFAYTLVKSMPKSTQEHYGNKIGVFNRWWKERGYPDGIPDEADYSLEIAKKVPSWRRVCKAILRNDYSCKSLGFTQHRSAAYQKYLDLMRKRKEIIQQGALALSDG